MFQVVEVLHDLAESVKSEEDGTTKYQVFQDRSQGDELVVLEQCASLRLRYTFPCGPVLSPPQVQRQSRFRISWQFRPLPKGGPDNGKGRAAGKAVGYQGARCSCGVCQQIKENKTFILVCLYIPIYIDQQHFVEDCVQASLIRKARAIHSDLKCHCLFTLRQTSLFPSSFFPTFL